MMIDKNEVLKQYHQTISNINSQSSLKEFLRVMAMHPYTDFANCILLMHNNPRVGVYSIPGAHDNADIMTGFVYNPKTSKLDLGMISYLNKPGPLFNRKRIEAHYGLINKYHTGNKVIIEDNGDIASIYYPETWDDVEKAEALIEIIYDMFSTSDDQTVKCCCIYMSLIYAGFCAYLPSSTFNDITESNSIDIRIPLSYIGAHYQALHRRLYGTILTPLEIRFLKDYHTYKKIDNPILLPYKEALEHIFKERMKEMFSLDFPYFPSFPVDHFVG